MMLSHRFFGKKWTSRAFRLSVAAAAALPMRASADLLYWDTNQGTANAGTTASGTWDGTDPGLHVNWNTELSGTGGTSRSLTTASDDLIFSSGTGLTGTSTVTLVGTQFARKITVEEGAITFASGTISLGNGGFEVLSTASGTATTVGGTTAMTLSAAQAWSVADTKQLTINGSIAFDNALTVNNVGGGILRLAGANTGAGGVIHNSGVLIMNNAGAIGTGVLTVNGGQLNSSGVTLTNSGHVWGGDFAFIGSANFSLGIGNVSLNAAAVQVTHSGTATRTIGGAVTGTSNLTLNYTNDGALTFTGLVNNTGTLNIGGAGTGAGVTTISGGVGANVTQINKSAVGAATVGLLTLGGDLPVNSTSASGMTLNGGSTGTGNLTLNTNAAGGITASTAALNHTGTLTISGTGSGTTTISGGVGSNVGNIFLSGGGTTTTTLSTTAIGNTGSITNNGTTTNVTTISAPLSATVTSVVQNSATSPLVLSGTGTAFTGPINLNQGTLRLGSAEALSGGTLNIAAGTTLGASAATTLTTTNAQNWNGNFTFAGGFALNMGVGAVTVAPANLQLSNAATATFTIGGNVGGTSNLTLNNDNTGGSVFSGSVNTIGTFAVGGTGTGTTNVSGVLGSGITAINKSGTSGLTLSGASPNTYTGVATLNGGTLTLNKSPDVVAITGNLQINGGGLVYGAGANDQIANTATVTVAGGVFNGTATNTGVVGVNETIAALNATSGSVNLGGINASTGITVTGVASFTGSAGGGTIMVGNSGSLFTVGGLSLSGMTATAGSTVTTANSFTMYGANGTRVGTLTVGSLGLSLDGSTLNLRRGGSGNLGSRLVLNGDVSTIASSVQSRIIEDTAGGGTGGRDIHLGGVAGTVDRVFTVAAGTVPGGAADLLVNLPMVNGTATTANLVKDGAGVMDIALGATYTGSTTVRDGTLRLTVGANRLPVATTVTLGTATTSGVLDLNGNAQTITGLTIAGGATSRVTSSFPVGSTPSASTTSILTINNATDGTLGNVLADGAAVSGFIPRVGLAKLGAGKLTLTASQSYSGGTTVNGGILNLANGASSSGSVAGTGTLTLGSTTAGSIFATDPTVGGRLQSALVAGGFAHTIAPGGVGTAGLLNLAGAVTTNTNTTFNFDLVNGTFSGPSNDLISLTSSQDFVVGAATKITLGTSLTTTGAYNLFNIASYTGAPLTLSNFTLPAAGAGYTYSLAYDNPTTPTLVQLLVSDFAAYTWNSATGGTWASTTNWTPAGSFPNATGHTATLGEAIGVGTAVITLDGDKTVQSLTISPTTAGKIYDVAPGTGGKLILNNGGSAATIAVTANAHTISAGIDLASNTNVNLSTGTTLTASGVMSGTGTLTKIGGGVLLISGGADNTNGALVVNAGTVTLGKTAGVIAANGPITIVPTTAANGALLRLSAANQIADNAVVSVETGTGIANAAAFDLDGFNETIGSLNIVMRTTGQSMEIRTDGGTLTVLGDITWSGNSGAPGGGNVSRITSSGGGSLNLGGTLHTITTNNNLTGAANNHPYRIDSPISGTGGGIIKAGPADLILGGVSTYTGTTTIADGGLRLLGGDNRLPVGTFLTFGAGTTSGTLNLTGNNQTVAGIATAGSGTANRIIGSFSGTPTADTLATFTANLASGTTTLGSALTIQDGAVVSTFTPRVGLTKAGAGTLSLGGSHSYSGPTTITGGVLALTGASSNNIPSSASIVVGDSLANSSAVLDVTGLSAGTLVLAMNQTVKGHGTISGGLEVGAAAAISPGTSIGTITSGSETWAAGGTYIWEISDPAGTTGTLDHVEIDGTLNITATPASPFVINIQRLGLAVGATLDLDAWYTIAHADAVTGFAANKFYLPDVGGDLLWEIREQDAIGGGRNIQISPTPVPEPTGLAALAMAGFGLLVRRRRRTITN